MTSADPAEAVLEGEKVRLRPFTDDDVPLMHRWLNDREVLHWLHLSEDPPEMLTPFENHVERWERIRDNPRSFSWIIEMPDGEPLGHVDLIDMHPSGRAELGIALGERELWGQGLGTDAITTLLRYSFSALDLRRVWLITDVDNERGIRCYEKCGFKREGLLRGHRLRYGEPLDMLIMGVLRDEFAAEA